MGLDMFLTKSIYVGAKFEHRQVQGTVNLTANGKTLNVNVNRISEIIEEVGYWRKANSIHHWFVQNVQDGRDECQRSYVSIEQLKELRELCKHVLKTKDSSLLPTCSGFFFGSTEIDVDYWDDLHNTVEILSNIDESADYYYQASW